MNILKDLVLEEVSLVDVPANASATVALFKRDNSKGDTTKMSDYDKKMKAYMDKGYSKEEAEKMMAMEKSAGKVEELEKSVEDLKKTNEDLRKALIENDFVITKDGIEKKQAPETIEVNGEQVAKADIPAPVLKALEEAEVTKAEAELAKADAELEKKATELLKNMPVDKAKKLIKSFEEDKELMEFLASLDAAIEAGFHEFGKTDVDGDMNTAQDKLDKMVAEYAAENDVTKYVAYAEVAKTAEGKKLVQETYEKDAD